MTLLEFPIRRYQFTLIAFLCLAALGWYAFNAVPREEDPAFKIPAYFITTIMPGSDPKDLERLVTKPMEDRIAELDDVRHLESTVVDGVSFIAVEFQAWVDADQSYNDVTREINALRPSLPPEIASIEIRKISPGLVNIVQLALVSDEAPYSELEDYARELKDALKAVPGVRTAESWAYPGRELRVAMDVRRMASLHIAPSQLIAALTAQNANIPAGFIDLGNRSFSLKTGGTYTSVQQVLDTVIASNGSSAIHVSDVAEVHWDSSNISYLGRFNGHRAVFVTANQKDGQNILELQHTIDTTLNNFEKSLPARVKLERGFEQSRNVASRLDRLYRDFAIAICLVLLTLLPLGLRAASIVMLAIPLSLACGLAALYFLGYSLNQLSIAGFVVALGLLVDDSIVVVENIARHLRTGLDRTQAALAGTRQIFAAILGCTATLVFAFLPLLALPGLPGKFIRVLPLTVVATIVGSLLIALFIIPFLASRLLPMTTASEGSPLLQRLMSAIHGYYRPALHFCLAHARSTAALAIGGSLLLSALLAMGLGKSLFPKADTPQFLITVETPNGSSLAATDNSLRFVEATLHATPEVASYYANLGHGNPKVYYNQIVHTDAPNFAELFVQLKTYDTRHTPQVLENLRAKFERYAPAHVHIHEFINGTPISAPVAVRVIGPDLVTLRRLGGEVERLIRATPGTRDVSNPLRIERTNLKLVLDSEKANLLGVPAAAFDQAARLGLSGVPAGTYKESNGEQYPIQVRIPIDAHADMSTLRQVEVPTANGALLPLSQLATLEFEAAPSVIQRYGRERAVVIDAQVLPGFNTHAVTDAVVRQLEALAWPRGYHYVLGGEAESSAESFGGIGTAIIIALFGIFAILVLEFGSFQATLIVLTVVPLGIMGGLLALLLTGNDLSFVASVGFVALIGIEIKNSILLVDFTNQLRADGVALDAAIERAGEVRFLPILLTSVTAIGGLLPLALQNIGLYSPMAWVIIGGLASSTLLARLVTPVIYKLMPPPLSTPIAPALVPPNTL